MQDYEFLRVAVMIYDILVNTQTHTQTAFSPALLYWSESDVTGYEYVLRRTIEHIRVTVAHVFGSTFVIGILIRQLSLDDHRTVS